VNVLITKIPLHLIQLMFT